MASLNLYDLYNRKVRKFGINDSPYFRESFVDAVNLVYSELNEKVFEASSLQSIGSFNDVIDTRLAFFTDMTFGSDCNDAIKERELWAIEWELERTSLTNSFKDKIESGGLDSVGFLIADGVFSVDGSLTGHVELPDESVITLRFESKNGGSKVYVNGVEYSIELGSDTLSINAVASHKIENVSGYELKATRFYSEGTKIYEFNLDEESTNTNLTDVIAEYTATLTSPQWDERYVEPTTGLDERYRAAFEMGLDFHIQDGGQWGLEDDGSRERKWYGRGISSARTTYQQLSTYVNPLGI